MGDFFQLKKKIQTAFKLSGFLVKSDSIQFLCEQLAPFSSEENEKLVSKIIESLQTMKLSSTNISKDLVEQAVNRIHLVDLCDDETIFSVISAFEVPRFTFSSSTKKFYRDNDDNTSFLPEASAKAKYLQNRYKILLQKAMRHELFAENNIEGVENGSKKFRLYFAENLLSQSQVKEVVILGLLTQLSEGKYFLEDLTGIVELDLQEAHFHSGFYCEGSFILAEGRYEDQILKVSSIGFPPSEIASFSRSYFGTQNSWGGKSSKLLKYSTRLGELEQTNKEATIVFLSDVRLDIPVVTQKLKTLFIGYDECPPVAIVLMGPFCQMEKSVTQKKQFFDILGDLADGCEHLKQQTDLVLVPSQEDPAAPNILPRQPIPEYFVKELRRKWKRLKLATNPCRLQYCTQQIIVCKADLFTKFCRNTIHFPSDSNLANHFGRTLVCQGTLTPVQPIVIPVYWNYDTALQLYPLPDLIVIGDPSDSFSTIQAGCTILNTGSFIKSNFSFKVYVPSSKLVEDSEIPDN
ncbi:DNA polymerase epsilon subunit 2 [Condylostylus longicornis]|uniref:DNA polymerase epsilon subunit 2 n=1 Tax=Condylostylus longicornis TaxID=2530218 RepID=UPI00244E100D|nr:DNA polymerase epsilon subunit 2 [Condylostylus longicornis]